MADRDPIAEALQDMPWKEIAQGLAPVLAIAYLGPALVAAIHDGTIGIPVFPTIGGTLHIATQHHWRDPAAAYPTEIARHMPGPRGWWLTLLATLGLIGLIAAWAWSRLEPITAQAYLGRRDNQLRGSRPRTWAKPRDLRGHIRPRQPANRFTVGKLNGRTVYTGPEDHIAVVAPTRSGKTTLCVIPWLLEHPGPAIVTSTKTDVLEATEAHRRSLGGRVHIWDPFGPRTCHWTPVTHCEDWHVALDQGHSLAEAVNDTNDSAAVFWRAEAAKLLQPLLHAAALSYATIADLLGWVDRQDETEPAAILRTQGHRAASDQLASVLGLDDRNRGTTFMSASSLLAAYRHEIALGHNSEPFDPWGFLDGAPNTLYIVASASDQQRLAPVAAALLNTIMHRAMKPNSSIPVPLRLLIDEAANIAPLRDLPGYLAQAAAHNIRIATIWQDLGQLRGRYGAAADTILANSNAKLFMGPVTDEPTRSYLIGLLGDHAPVGNAEDVQERGRRALTTSAERRRPIADARTLQQLRWRRAVYINGSHPPAMIATGPRR